jgi:SAM-dependent methyltransferase
LLVELNVFSQNKSELFWNFLPVYGEKLLLFKDLPTRRHLAEYVWLRTNPKSTSWQFVDFLKIKKNESVIDLGCGTGLNAFRAAKHSNQVTGIDLNPRAINLAKFNQELNSFSNTSFYQSAWSDFAKKDFNHIISQPPFDPDFDDSNKILAFNGGKDYGLEATFELITKYLPKNKNQSLHLYVHSFAKGQDLLLEEILKNKLPANNSYEIRLIKKYQIDDWWAEYKVRHNLNVRMVLPDEWRCFTGVFGMYLKILYIDRIRD